MTTTYAKVLVKLNTVYVDDESWNTALEDMLSRDKGVVVEEDKESGEILVELEKCTIARWENFGFKVTVLNEEDVSSWAVKGFTSAQLKEEYEYDEYEKANLASGFCPDGCCGEGRG